MPETTVELAPMVVVVPTVKEEAAAILESAARRIEDPDKWAVGALCQNQRTCAVGAMVWVAIEARGGEPDEESILGLIAARGVTYRTMLPDEPAYTLAVRAADASARALCGWYEIWQVNDHLADGRQQVVECMRDAAAKLRAGRRVVSQQPNGQRRHNAWEETE